MNIYAISDLHLAISAPEKNMNIFGSQWENYMEQIKNNWITTCSDDDIIIIPGDISWAMNIIEMEKDFNYLKELPGTKLLLKGNHDYWWETSSKLDTYKNAHGLEKIFFIQNTSYMAGKTAICGTRGWILPEDKKFTDEDIKIYKRELGRLRLSLEDAASKGAEKIIAAFHYPPFSLVKNEDNEFIQILKEYNVEKCIFGHIHATNYFFDLWKNITWEISSKTNIEFSLVSADFLCFIPNLLVDELEL